MRAWSRRGTPPPDPRVPPRWRSPLAAIRARSRAWEGAAPAVLRGHLATAARALAAGAAPGAQAPAVFAVVQLLIARELGLALADMQLVAGLALAEGRAVELATGQGKTLAAAAPAVLAALTGEGVHVLTANDYLATVGAATLAPVYAACGLTVAVRTAGDARRHDPAPGGGDPWHPCAPAAAYAAAITYSTPQAVGFDWLRDELARDAAARVQRGRHAAIIDELDSVLLDEATTPLILARPGPPPDPRVCPVAAVVAALRPGRDLAVVGDDPTAPPQLTPAGEEAVAAGLGLAVAAGLYAADGDWLPLVRQAVLARWHYAPGREYLVHGGAIVFLDPTTGRPAPERRWGEGLHQALEARHGLPPTPDHGVAATTTLPAYLRDYRSRAGMSGTLAEAADELGRAHGMVVQPLPATPPSRRADAPPRAYRTRRAAILAARNTIVRHRAAGRPVLVGVSSVADAEQLGATLGLIDLPHQALTAANSAAEAALIARAGRAGTVTIATAIAGRGTDIPLDDAARAAGGLHVVVVGLPPTRRATRQFLGRAARRGDPGSTEQLFALDDPLLVRFLPACRLAGWAATPGPPEAALRRPDVLAAAAACQARQEARDAAARDELARYERLERAPAATVAGWRERARDLESRLALLADWFAPALADARARHAPTGALADLHRACVAVWRADLLVADDLATLAAGRPAAARLIWLAWLRRWVARAGADCLAAILGDALDAAWADYLAGLVALRSAAGWQGLAGRDPAEAYVTLAHTAFAALAADLPEAIRAGLRAADLPPLPAPRGADDARAHA
jgi:preprotein translocase subunit SecA